MVKSAGLPDVLNTTGASDLAREVVAIESQMNVPSQRDTVSDAKGASSSALSQKGG